jgi:phage tail sheath protein FI
MPGVVVTTGTIAGPSAPARAPSSQYFAAGLADRGPTDAPVQVNSFADFRARFGDRPSYGTLWDDIRTYFEEGGARAQVVRIVGPAATAGALASALGDRATTPDDTLNVTAVSPGGWSSHVKVNILDGATTSTFRLQVLLDDVVVEDYSALTSPQHAISRVNANSLYIRLADAGSASTAPQNNPKATTTPVALAAGTDDRASVTSTHYIAALTKFTKGMGDGAVALPGVGQAVHVALIAHADANNRVAILASARGDSRDTLASYAASLDAKRAGLFAPWIRIPDDFGGTRAISPEGYIAASRSRAHESDGPWRAAAGENSKARFVVAPDQDFSASDGDLLDASKVNVVRTIAGSVRLYGWRSLSADFDNWSMLTGADVLDRYVTAAEQALEPYLFGVIDSSGHLLANVRGVLIGIAQPMADAGGLFARVVDGEVLDPGYVVNTDAVLNSTASLALNRIFANVGLRVSPTAAVIYLTVSKAGVAAAL